MFEQEKVIPIVATLLVEMSLYALLILLRDTFEVVFQFRSTGSFLHSLYVSCISYGLFEELVKIIPLLILIHFRKIINEPIDYVIYACVSALGFSFIENCIYLSNNNLLVDHSYSLINVVEHMFHTSIIAYGIVLAKFKRHKNPYLTTLFYLSISAFSHGFYSLFSTNGAFIIWKILSLFHFVIALLIWNTILNNCLNHSSFYDQKKIKDNTSIHSYLIYGLIGIGVLEYFINASKCGPQIANEMVFSSLKNGFFMIYLIGTNLSNFVHEKGVWSATKLIKESQPYNFDSVLDAKVSNNMITRNNYLSTLLPNSGKINRRVNVTNEPDWYLVELDLVKNLELFETKTILIRTKNQSEIMKPEGTFIIAFYSIPKDYSFDSETIDRKVCSFREWATLHFV